MMVPGDDADAASNRTIQVDALNDVQLVDAVASADDDPPPAVSAPPPLPRKKPRSVGRTLGLTLVAIVAGAGLGFLVIHFLFAPPPVTVAVPPASGAAPSPSSAPPPTTAPRVRRITLDDEPIRVSAPRPE